MLSVLTVTIRIMILIKDNDFIRKSNDYDHNVRAEVHLHAKSYSAFAVIS